MRQHKPESGYKAGEVLCETSSAFDEENARLKESTMPLSKVAVQMNTDASPQGKRKIRPQILLLGNTYEKGQQHT